MADLNFLGFVVKEPSGQVRADSHVSAYSRRVAIAHSILEPVSGVDGLYVRRYGRDRVAPDQRERTFEAARTWYAERFGVPESVAAELVAADSDGPETVAEAEVVSEPEPTRKPKTKRAAKPAAETDEVTL